MISSHDKLSSFQSHPKRPREEYDSAADWEDTRRKRKGLWGYLKKEEFFKWAIVSYSKRRETKRDKIERAIFSFFDDIKVFLILFEVVGIFVISGISLYVIAGNKKWEDISPFWQWYTYVIMGGMFAFPWLHLLNTFLSSRFGASLWDILVSPFKSLCYRILDRFFPPVIEKPSLDTIQESENDPGFYFQVCERDLENRVFLMKKIWTERGRGIEYLDQAIQKVLKKYEITEIKTLADFCVAMGCVAKPEWEREGLPVPSGLSSDGLDVTRVLSCCLDGLKNEDTLWTEVYLSLQRVLSEAKGNDSEESYHTDQTTQ